LQRDYIDGIIKPVAKTIKAINVKFDEFYILFDEFYILFAKKLWYNKITNKK
jgi:hypothetical protein